MALCKVLFKKSRIFHIHYRNDHALEEIIHQISKASDWNFIGLTVEMYERRGLLAIMFISTTPAFDILPCLTRRDWRNEPTAVMLIFLVLILMKSKFSVAHQSQTFRVKTTSHVVHYAFNKFINKTYCIHIIIKSK